MPRVVPRVCVSGGCCSTGLRSGMIGQLALLEESFSISVIVVKI